MKLSLIELYELVGDDMGISFNYAELPGVVVTIGFSRADDESEVDEEFNDEEQTDAHEPQLH